MSAWNSAEKFKIVDYFLRRLDAAEAEGIEEKYFGDQRYFELMQEIEQDLIDSYARNQLREEDARDFARNFLVTKERNERVQTARLVARWAQAQANRAPAGRTYWFQIRPLWAATAAAVALAIGYWAVAEVGNRRKGPAPVARQIQPPPAPVPSPVTPREQPAPQQPPPVVAKHDPPARPAATAQKPQQRLPEPKQTPLVATNPPAQSLWPTIPPRKRVTQTELPELPAPPSIATYNPRPQSPLRQTVEVFLLEDRPLTIPSSGGGGGTSGFAPSRPASPEPSPQRSRPVYRQRGLLPPVSEQGRYILHLVNATDGPYSVRIGSADGALEIKLPPDRVTQPSLNQLVVAINADELRGAGEYTVTLRRMGKDSVTTYSFRTGTMLSAAAANSEPYQIADAIACYDEAVFLVDKQLQQSTVDRNVAIGRCFEFRGKTHVSLVSVVGASAPSAASPFHLRQVRIQEGIHASKILWVIDTTIVPPPGSANGTP